jgi:lipoyl-dependent peroxiredoxin
MPTRNAHARWEGSIKEGKGQVDFGNGAFKGAYSFASRFEDGKGTNPEELLGAAHAGCFAMALSLILGNAGFKPDYVDATAHVTVSPQAGAFAKHAEAAKAGCPVSQALAGTTITLDATLASG